MLEPVSLAHCKLLNKRNMKSIIAGLLIFVSVINCFGQANSFNDYMSQGISFHDEGKYDEAIGMYKKALELDPKSSVTNYEISLTYFSKQDWAQAIEYGKNVINLNTGNRLEAFVVLGNSYDMLGDTKHAISTYVKGLKEFPQNHLLNYNLALTYYNSGNQEKAEKAVIKAITLKPTHGSSHLLLSAIMNKNGSRVQNLLPLYYFLMIEPMSKRSNQNYQTLKSKLGYGVEQKDDKNINVNLPMSKGTDSEFGAADMMISLTAASKYLEENMSKSELELFSETNKSIFTILGELKGKNKGFWWDFYVTSFYDLVNSDNVEAFSYYISQSDKSDLVNKWIIDNSTKIQSLTNWIEKTLPLTPGKPQ